MIRQSGFTLPELMVTVAILAIIGSLAIPSIRDFQSNVRMSTTANLLAVSLKDARSKSIATRRNVVVSAINTTTGWRGGWQTAFQTPLATDPANPLEGQDIPANITVGPNPVLLTMTMTGSTGQVTRADGTVLNMVFTVCDSGRTGELGYNVMINQFGRVAVMRHTAVTTCGT